MFCGMGGRWARNVICGLSLSQGIVTTMIPVIGAVSVLCSCAIRQNRAREQGEFSIQRSASACGAGRGDFFLFGGVSALCFEA